jgi:outer membrane immunogenic protein
MRKVAFSWFVACLGFGLASEALAADLPVVRKAPPVAVAPVYNWSGLYAGGHAGYGWGRSTWTDVAGLVGDDNTRHNINGALAGLQLGFNVQQGAWVFGVEGDFSWADIKGSSLFDGVDPVETKIRWLSTLTGRVGYAHGAWLPYVKGGAVWANERMTISLPLAPGAPITVTTDTRTGWTAGAGLEYGFTPNWSARIEYDYFDLGTSRAQSAFAGFPLDVKAHLHAVKFALNYRFGWR